MSAEAMPGGAALNASVGAITLFVDDPRRSEDFYRRAFGVESVFTDENSVVFRFDTVVINLLQRSSADGLVDPAPVAAAGAGSSFQLTIWVEDADAACRELAERNVSLLNGPVDRPWRMRTAAFADPDGHVWEVAQPLG